MRKILSLIIAAVLCIMLLGGCDMSIESANTQPSLDAAGRIELLGNTAETKAGGVSFSGNVITVSSAGSYSVCGELGDGQIIIDTGEDAGKVSLILDNARITNPNGPALWVKQAKKLDLVIAPNSENTLISGTEGMVFDPNASGGAIYAEDDLDIEGEDKGKLSIFGHINSGIVCKDDVDIKCGNCEINIFAANNGIKGSESITVSGGVITIDAGHDGMKSSSADKPGKGFVSVTGGIIDIRAHGDGIAAETELNISGGVITAVTEGDPNAASCKGIKAKTGVNIIGGVLVLNSADHAVHSAAGLKVSGGSFEIVSADKGFAAHGDIDLDGGAFTLNTADDGIETTGNISFTGGAYDITAGGDGIKSGESGVGNTVIDGGAISVSAGKDAFDVQGELVINHGYVLALGSSKLVKSFSDESEQGFAYAQIEGPAGSTVKVNNNSIEASFPYNLVLYSSSELVKGGECEISCGTKTVSVEVQ